MSGQVSRGYFNQHQHSSVPIGYKENPQLGVWVANQRQFYKKGELSQRRIDLLNQLNFDLNPLKTRWNKMYEQLQEYFNQHQHSNVPTVYKENLQLARWVSRQRHAYKKGKLSQDRIELLNQLNFDWRN